VPGEGKGFINTGMLQLPVGGRGKAHPSKHRGRRHAKEMFRKKSQRTSKTTTGRVFSTKLTTSGVFFAATIKGKIEEQLQLPAQWNGRPLHPYSSKMSSQQVSLFGLQVLTVNLWTIY
jgi:hypothetical protein